MSRTEIKPVSRKSDLVTQEHEKEILIYDLLIDKAYSLNETSSLIWNLCNGKNSVAEITSSLSKKLNSSVNEDFVWLALEQLKKDNLLANGEEISIDFGGLSRRDVIRKIGFASLVALPVISSLIAPTSINAASNCPATLRPNGCACTSNSQCGPGSTTGCCYDNSACNTRFSTPNGNACSNNNCQCASNCCGFGSICYDSTVKRSVGDSCRVNCECPNSCSGGLCN